MKHEKEVFPQVKQALQTHVEDEVIAEEIRLENYVIMGHPSQDMCQITLYDSEKELVGWLPLQFELVRGDVLEIESGDGAFVLKADLELSPESVTQLLRLFTNKEMTPAEQDAAGEYNKLPAAFLANILQETGLSKQDQKTGQESMGIFVSPAEKKNQKVMLVSWIPDADFTDPDFTNQVSRAAIRLAKVFPAAEAHIRFVVSQIEKTFPALEENPFEELV